MSPLPHWQQAPVEKNMTITYQGNSFSNIFIYFIPKNIDSSYLIHLWRWVARCWKWGKDHLTPSDGSVENASNRLRSSMRSKKSARKTKPFWKNAFVCFCDSLEKQWNTCLNFRAVLPLYFRHTGRIPKRGLFIQAAVVVFSCNGIEVPM